MIALTILCIATIAPVILVTGYFALEVFAGLSPIGKAVSPAASRRTLIIVPAHDEEAVIEGSVKDLIAVGAGFELLVVADNCADRTASVAERAGAQVVVRNDPERRGKGFALAAARDFARSNPPDVVIILDADCRLDGASLRELSAAAASAKIACQAVNLLAPDLSAPALVQISNFGFMIKNLVRQRGLQRLADRAHLTGTGMALPWDLFDGVDLGGSNIVEDLALGLDLADRAHPPQLIEKATVWSPPASAKGTLVQRRRWEGGYLATALKRAPAALVRGFVRGDLRGVAAALDLSVPPLALLVVLNIFAIVVGLIAVAIGASLWPLALQAAVALTAAVALALAWMREGRRFASGATLLRLPIYVLWKLPIYLGFVRAGTPKEWLRSGR